MKSHTKTKRQNKHRKLGRIIKNMFSDQTFVWFISVSGLNHITKITLHSHVAQQHHLLFIQRYRAMRNGAVMWRLTRRAETAALPSSLSSSSSSSLHSQPPSSVLWSRPLEPGTRRTYEPRFLRMSTFQHAIPGATNVSNDRTFLERSDIVGPLKRSLSCKYSLFWNR